MKKTNQALLDDVFRKLLTELVNDAELESDSHGLVGSEKAVFTIEYMKNFGSVANYDKDVAEPFSRRNYPASA